jgi:D-alanyl-D-alanine carboxypeptidase/D-alanyl-D-alanine-endopeptidase (penicillin-binding protein 4)
MPRLPAGGGVPMLDMRRLRLLPPPVSGLPRRLVTGFASAVAAASLALLFSAVLAPVASAAGLAATQRVLEREMAASGPAAGAYVVDLDSGAPLFADDPDTPRIPASVNKLYTTSTALQRFGPDATLQTRVLADAAPDADGVIAGNLYLRGGGDPYFGTTAARALIRRLAAAGVTEVDGRVVGDESAWDGRRGGPASSYRTSWWVGPLSALTFNRGLTGRRRPVFQASPPRYAAASFARELKRAGIFVGRSARTGATPATARPLDAWPSATIAQIAARTNVPSDNFNAESLLKALGAEFGLSGSTGSGAAVVRATVEKLGAAPRIMDGSGLSRRNRTTPHDVVDLIRGMDRSAASEAFASSLAVAGRTGTLERRMRGSAARDRCHAKTGTLSDVSALAGFCETRGGRRVAFAFLMNGVYTPAAQDRQDRMTAALARYG